MRKIWVIGIVSLLLASCGEPAPQRPSQRKSRPPQVDSTAMALLELNQQLAASADKLLTQKIQTLSQSYALYDSSVWMYIIDRGDETTASPVEGEEWTVHMRVYNLDEKLLVDSEASYRLGKYELPQAVDGVMGELHHGAQARLYAPWYTAFGMQGTAQVPPYENVIIDIELR